MSFEITLSFSPEQQKSLDAALAAWDAAGNTKRLWAREESLWTGSGESQWLGWLDIVTTQLKNPNRFAEISQNVQAQEFTDVVVLGMGGSSLCPDVLAKAFGHRAGHPRLHVLDSTDPAQVLSVEHRVNLKKTLFIVSSKSGSTLEPSIFLDYFFDRAGRDGSRFCAITDPGSKLEATAKRDGFARIFYGVPEIGGRFSALSDFGMVPAAAMGLDVPRLLEHAQEMADACQTERAQDNPGVLLGLILGTLAKLGRDKLTILTSPKMAALGGWQEQLVAESTGKHGKGIIPVDLEPPADPSIYGPDRLFVYQKLAGDDNEALDTEVKGLEEAGHPVVRIPVDARYLLGAEFFRWEIATAVAGALLQINPFDQPDVEFSKVETKKLTSAFEETGDLPSEEPAFEEDGIKVYGKTTAISLDDALSAHFADIPKAGEDGSGAGYVALLAYVEMTDPHIARIQSMRQKILHTTGAATCMGFGPRFLHSTGQAYKGGPPGGVFLQITCDDEEDVAVPGAKYTFGVVKAAQAQGDLQVLRDRGRRSLRVHLGKDVDADLKKLALAVDRALR